MYLLYLPYPALHHLFPFDQDPGYSFCYPEPNRWCRHLQYRGEFGILGPMARQTGLLKITGTIDGICFYQMEGKHYARKKTSLTGKRFRKDAAFAGSRRSAGLLQQASPLASRLYQLLPREKKGRPVYQGLVGKVKLMLQAGQTEAAIRDWFNANYFPARQVEGDTSITAPPTQKFAPPAKYHSAFPGFAHHRLTRLNSLQQPVPTPLQRIGKRYKNKPDHLPLRPVALYT